MNDPMTKATAAIFSTTAVARCLCGNALGAPTGGGLPA
jgi:hypothetical protein